MDKKRVSIFFVLLAVFAISFLLLFSDIVVKPGPPKIYHISMITRGKNASAWASIREGANLAADDNNIELSFILLGEDNNATEQIALLRRESVDADAILLSAADSAALGSALTTMALKTPVICFESPVDGAPPYVSADNYAMGARLGRQMLTDGQPVRLALVENTNNSRSLRERREGLLSVLEKEGIHPAIWELPANSDDIPAYMLRKIAQRDVDAIVALDFLSLEQTAQYVDDSNWGSKPAIYGIGSTDKILSFLEQGTISSIVVQNDFALGYLSVEAAMNTIKGNSSQKIIPIEHKLVNGKTMYNQENQSLLFPFIR